MKVHSTVKISLLMAFSIKARIASSISRGITKVKRNSIAGLLALLLASTAIVAGGPADAQQYRRAAADTVLVTPDGDLLDYMPESGEVIIGQNSEGQRVLIDHYGNLVATEMPAERYYNGGTALRDTAATDDGWADSDPYADDQFTTGAIPRNDVSRLPLDEQTLPPPEENGYGDDQAALPAEPEVAPDLQPATPMPTYDLKDKSSIEITALQVMLDRDGASPGVIDGKNGSNVAKAIAAWEQITGETLDPKNTEAILERLRLSGGLPIVSYEITPADAAGPYVAEIPEDYSQKALLPSMAYTSVSEALAERFHMDEAYLKALNPGADFTVPGTIIKVTNPGQIRSGQVARIVADKGRKQVFAYGADNQLIAAYPASIGSSDTPSPSGLVNVDRVALNPGYTYNPKINFQQGSNTKILQIPPGPNGPVGTVWIALSKPTYGIHGTPEPSKIGRTQSHGCIRLANWDATELAKMVKPGVTVEFVD